jgi:hypothetical protein
METVRDRSVRLLALASLVAATLGACTSPGAGAAASPSASEMMEHPSASEMMEHPSASEMMEHPSASP